MHNDFYAVVYIRKRKLAFFASKKTIKIEKTKPIYPLKNNTINLLKFLKIVTLAWL